MPQHEVGRIEEVVTFGDFVVYRRCWIEPGLRKYVVYRNSDDKALEEFRRVTTAINWAKREAKETVRAADKTEGKATK